MTCPNAYSLVTFKSVYVSYVIPKTYFNATSNKYYVTVTVCVELPQMANTRKPSGSHCSRCHD